ncbi:MAG: UDP-N-acetylglucosamine 4,6-dehydratase (inverting), partial [Bacteroidales bacterium]|nr:UDP-N-acetylglucosamine 4,6-dehydratase (inverting) [Bacteroidales bacterium]
CEKLHEEMISANDAPYTIDLGYCYAILPSISFNGKRSKEDYIKHYGAKPVGDGFRYGSDCSPLKESVESLREKISAVYD